MGSIKLKPHIKDWLRAYNLPTEAVLGRSAGIIKRRKMSYRTVMGRYKERVLKAVEEEERGGSRGLEDGKERLLEAVVGKEVGGIGRLDEGGIGEVGKEKGVKQIAKQVTKEMTKDKKGAVKEVTKDKKEVTKEAEGRLELFPIRFPTRCSNRIAASISLTTGWRGGLEEGQIGEVRKEVQKDAKEVQKEVQKDVKTEAMGRLELFPKMLGERMSNGTAKNVGSTAGSSANSSRSSSTLASRNPTLLAPTAPAAMRPASTNSDSSSSSNTPGQSPNPPKPTIAKITHPSNPANTNPANDPSAPQLPDAEPAAAALRMVEQVGRIRGWIKTVRHNGVFYKDRNGAVEDEEVLLEKARWALSLGLNHWGMRWAFEEMVAGRWVGLPAGLYYAAGCGYASTPGAPGVSGVAGVAPIATPAVGYPDMPVFHPHAPSHGYPMQAVPQTFPIPAPIPPVIPYQPRIEHENGEWVLYYMNQHGQVVRSEGPGVEQLMTDSYINPQAAKLRQAYEGNIHVLS
ncbi:Protein of unknown function [Pyronema omphalodes CBS 100304]|uniref:Uncharacterized protein n=1 Tax=Pyronema omphalodes (strain CBS 100304) TaxID=1076935 RepID=U4LVH6_PYROM|nr:Protein of unknown function [Pyronema omphalodes CBS 100304]